MQEKKIQRFLVEMEISEKIEALIQPEWRKCICSLRSFRSKPLRFTDKKRHNLLGENYYGLTEKIWLDSS